MFQCLSYLQNFILLKSVEYIKSYRYLSVVENFEFRFSRLRRHLKHKNGATQYTHIKVGRNESCFSNDPLNGDNKYAASDICKMIEFLMDNIYVMFGGQLFRQTVGIPM